MNFLIDRMRQQGTAEAMVWNGESFSYLDLLQMYQESVQLLEEHEIALGTVFMLHSDFSPKAAALLLALIETQCIIVPFALSEDTKRAEFSKIAGVEAYLKLDGLSETKFEKSSIPDAHPLVKELRKRQHAGLILFSSGSTGVAKGAIHDFSLILEKFKVVRPAKRMCAFLLFDHIGGLNTLLHSLSTGGSLVTFRERSPQAIVKAIEKYKIELLPTSPSFINLLLITEAYKGADLSSLKVVTYGTEPMPESTLKRFHEKFPNILLQQTYGLSELGIMRSKSKSSDSLWVKIGGEGFETRVREGMLEIKAKSAMLGYLNAPSPFTEDGWFKTGDVVEVDGEYFKILGRNSEMINVGGQKTFPAEIESVLQEMPGVEEVVVISEKNLVLNHIIVARVRLSTQESLSEFRIRMKTFCNGKIEAFKIPQKVVFFEDSSINERFKKIRNS